MRILQVGARRAVPVPEQKFYVPLLFRFGHLFQRDLERRVAQGLTEIMQRVPRRFAEFAGDGCGLAVVEGNLHLDVDSANLAPPVSQHDSKFRC